jgi:hypothetical protein
MQPHYNIEACANQNAFCFSQTALRRLPAYLDAKAEERRYFTA